MRINESVALANDKLLLVPYSKRHVETYHDWMKNPSLQEATASEPLTLEAEYDMQRSWRLDNDKLTFIICLPRESKGESIQPGTEDSSERMIGDINLFLSEPDDEDDEGESDASPAGSVIGEIELMIAKTDLQRKGYGRAAIRVFANYILENWETISTEYNPSKPTLKYFRVKINQTNAGSIKLFESIGFEWAAETANYFGEVELRWMPEKARLSLKETNEKDEAKELRYENEDAT